ncbi:MAG: hypothetical protein HY293_09205, partial [Planctomycetes bacterium]|nr:hypothetical protein [Planctomycetota bacterium]
PRRSWLRRVFGGLLGWLVMAALIGAVVWYATRTPPGTQPGQQFRLAGQGHRDRRGRRGDVIVTVRVEIPRRLTPSQRRLLEQARQDR